MFPIGESSQPGKCCASWYANNCWRYSKPLLEYQTFWIYIYMCVCIYIIYIYTLSVIQRTYCFWSLIQWDLQWLVFPIYPPVWCFHAPRKFLARLETVGSVRFAMEGMRPEGVEEWFQIPGLLPGDDCGGWLPLDLMIHNLPIIFPWCSNMFPLFPSFFHHLLIISPLLSHYFPSSFHYFSIIFPSSFHYLSIIFPLSSHTVLGVSPMGLWEWGSLYDSGGPWGPYEFHKVLIELKWWEMTRYRRDAG
jgi:hypothetical protein